MIATLTIVQTAADYVQEITVSLEEDFYALDEECKYEFFDDLVKLGKKAMQDAFKPEVETMDVRSGAPGEHAALDFGWYNPIETNAAFEVRVKNCFPNVSVYFNGFKGEEIWFKVNGQRYTCKKELFLQVYEYSTSQDDKEE